MNDEEVFSILLLVHNGLSVNADRFCMFNWFVRSSSDERPKVVQESSSEAWGTWGAFMKHCCNYNTAQVTDKRRILWCSTMPIKAGEQVCH